jgi:hypothetical protein
VNGIAKWDGRVWSGLGEGISEPGNTFTVPSVYALAVSGNDVYAGGRFAAAGRVPANGIAKWNGHNWSALGDGVRSGTNEGVVRALATRGKNLYAGGQFVTAGEVSAYNIAKWDGHSWSTLGSGIRGNLEQVLTVGVSRNIVYVGGRFTTAGGVSASNIAKWNGIHWSALPVQPYDGVWKIEVGTNSVYVGGVSFTLQNGVVAKGIVRWDGRTWSDLGDGVGNGSHTGPIMAIATTKSDLYVGGDSFIIPGARTPSAITAKWRVQK